jgi:pimeloyl-ACP methyl ester carboxylesterase
MALDVLALMDALRIEKAILVGYDLGSRSADIIAALWPHRCRALVSTTGYLITKPRSQPAAGGAGPGVGVLVSVLLLHGARRPGPER